MKKRIILSLLVVVVAVTALFGLTSCFKENDDETQYYREVELELINPNTGEVVNDGDTVILPKEKTYIEVRIKDKETGEYLKDEDLPETTILDSYHTNLRLYDDEWEKDQGPIHTAGYWPEEVGIRYDHYKVSIFFDCYPDGLNDPDFKRKYKITTNYIRIILSND